MAEYSLYGKRKLCYTDILDYTDYQGIGKDPLYKRYDSVKSVIKRYIPEEFHHFLSQPIYADNDDVINWYIEEWDEDPKRLVELNHEDFDKYNSIKETTLSVYKQCLQKLDGEDRILLGGALKYIHDDAIFCYDNKVVLVAWGMRPDTKRHIINGSVIHDFVLKKKFKINFNAGEHGHFKHKFDDSLQREEGYELSKEDLPSIIVDEGYSFKEWYPSPYGIKITKETYFKACYEPVQAAPSVTESSTISPAVPSSENSSKAKAEKEEIEYISVEFSSGDSGTLEGEASLKVPKGTSLNNIEIPEVIPCEEKIFIGWTPLLPNRFTKDCSFTANYEDKTYTCKFEAGESGSLLGTTSLKKKKDESILAYELPQISPLKGYRFVGWDQDPLTFVVDHDSTFTAQYEKKDPWYKRLWKWLTSENIKKWIKRLLLLLLLILLVILLSRSCSSCSRDSDSHYSKGAAPIEQITTPEGTTIDDNNNRNSKGSIIQDDGSLPDNQSFIVAPIRGEDGSVPPIHQEPGKPDIIANRLNIYFEDNNVNLQAFANAFKELYPGDEFQIIGCDTHVKMIQIQMPENQRNIIRDKLPDQLTEFKFFIVDESLFEGFGYKTSRTDLDGWHLQATRVQQAWEITTGDEDVVVAVVDDGLDYSHPMFEGRIVNAYNVFTQDNRLSMGEGHGTHVAGLAVGSTDFLSNGIAGIAPNCKLMPIQVFDNEFCTFSSVTSGIMYAIHAGADVINLSIGMSFQGLSSLPINQQRSLADILCKNEEMVWRRIIQIANKKNCILVFAVGNDKIIATIPPENRIGSSLNVAAVTPDLHAAQFSNFGEGSTISAPGVQILSAFPPKTFKSFDGTSMAAPIVTGTVALMRSIDKDINVEQALKVLVGTGTKIDQRIPPMIQIDKALMAVQSGNYSDFQSSEQEGAKDEYLSSPLPTNPGKVRPDESLEPDYSKIRALIEEYKRRIKELEKQLPENK